MCHGGFFWFWKAIPTETPPIVFEEIITQVDDIMVSQTEDILITQASTLLVAEDDDQV